MSGEWRPELGGETAPPNAVEHGPAPTPREEGPSKPQDTITRRVALGMATAGLASVAAPGLAVARRPPSRSKALLLPDARTVAARGDDPSSLSAVDCAALLQARLLSSRELTSACLAAIASRDGPLNAWVRVYAAEADAQARAADERLSRRGVARRGRRAPLLCGIPVGVKDIFGVEGLPLTAGSRLLAGQRARRDSTAWARLRYAGAICLGHTQTHEFAAGNFTPQSANPWDPTRTPGGSSGGSGAALAARMAPLALGSDTLGSLRIPASLCGVSALKPTYGLTSRTGVVPLAPSFDHVGPMARGAVDLGLLLSYLAGPDPLDAATLGDLPRPFFPVQAARGAKPLTGLRIGVPDQTFGGLEPTAAIAVLVERFARDLVELGARLVSVVAPRSPAENLSSPEGLQFFATVPGSETDAYHRRWFPQRAAEYTEDVAFTLGLLRASNTPPPDPAPGANLLADLRQNWLRTFREARLDALLQPAALIETPLREQAQRQTQALGDPMVVWDYTGFPALCLPAGRRAAPGLPAGVQLVGAPGCDAALLRIGVELQSRIPRQDETPPGL